jgi:hypothetical protein
MVVNVRDIVLRRVRDILRHLARHRVLVLMMLVLLIVVRRVVRVVVFMVIFVVFRVLWWPWPWSRRVCVLTWVFILLARTAPSVCFIPRWVRQRIYCGCGKVRLACDSEGVWH